MAHRITVVYSKSYGIGDTLAHSSVCKLTHEFRIDYSSTNSSTNLDDLFLGLLCLLGLHRFVDLTPFYSRELTCLVEVMADGSCDNVNNHMGCGFDGGDCCSYTTTLSEDALPWCEEDEQTVAATASAGSYGDDGCGDGGDGGYGDGGYGYGGDGGSCCAPSCYGMSCDGWVADGYYTCSDMESYGCSCTGCTCGEPSPTPAPTTSAPSEAPKCTERVEADCYDAAKFGLEVGSSNDAWRA